MRPRAYPPDILASDGLALIAQLGLTTMISAAIRSARGRRADGRAAARGRAA